MDLSYDIEGPSSSGEHQETTARQRWGGIFVDFACRIQAFNAETSGKEQRELSVGPSA